MDQKTLRKKKTSRGKVFYKYSSKKLNSYSDYNIQTVSNKAKGRKSEDPKDGFLKSSKNNDFTADTLINSSKIDEERIRSYADALAKTKKIWSQNNPEFEKEPFSFSLEHTAVKSNGKKHDRDLETDLLSKKTDGLGNFALWPTAVWETLDSASKCEDRYTAEDLLAEIKSLVLEDQQEIGKISSGSSSKDSLNLAKHVSLGQFDYLDKLLDDDSAYGSDESLPRSSPEPTDIETGLNNSASSDMFEDSYDYIESDPKTTLYSNSFKNITSSKFSFDQDSECICGGSDCDMHKTGEFQEFLNGLNSTKPRKVVHEIKKCAICENKIVDEFSLLNRFGLLLNCEHPFCYRCIFSACYRKKHPVSIFKVRCPICCAFSPGIVSSPRWIQSKIKKANLFKELKMIYVEWLVFKLYLNGKFFKI